MNRVTTEFINTNKLEEANPFLPVTPFYKNLDNPHVLATQESLFITYVVMPTWKLANKLVRG